MINMTFSKKIKQSFLLLVLVIIAVVVLGGVRIQYYIKSPDVLFLADRAGAHWIKYDSEFQLAAQPENQPKCEFRYLFHAGKEVDNARITVQSLKKCQVVFDGVTIFSSPDEFDKWKQVHDIALPFAVKAGPHEILIIVTSENSYPAVIAYSNNLPVSTGSGWFASIDGKRWRMAVPASQIKQAAISQEFSSSSSAALIMIMPYLAVVFVMALIISLLSSRQGNNAQNFSRWWREPSHVRWISIVLWAVLAVNNMFKLNFQVGDNIGHIEYIDYIVTKGSLPLASDGWEMFQTPLYYILSAPLYALLIKWFDLPLIVKILRIIPIICGLLQIEIVYRAARLVFVERKDLQIIAIVTGSLLPIHTYTCQFASNEPLAGCFISLVVLSCMSLLMPHQKERELRYFVLMGLMWGLALLSKITAILLGPVLIVVLLFHMKLVQRPFKSAVKPVAIIFGISILTAGWYYFRNYIELGSPAGIWDHLHRNQWWQDPSYRTWSQVLSFGQSFGYPVYAGVKSFWDTVYSTLWLDGFNSGLIDFMPWNENFMVAGALLALLPSMFILTGVIFIWQNKTTVYRNTVIFSIGSIVLFFAAMMDVYIRYPIYSTAKASYTLGLLPCYSILVAAGAEPFLRNRIIGSIAIALFACWAFAAYTAYFVIGFQ